jgi:DNA-binding response OmpR family regulator
LHGEDVPDSPRGPESSQTRVIVADDHPDAGESFAILLGMLGNYDVRNAFDGFEALRMAAEIRPHAVVLDIGMPGKDGYEVAREIRASDWGADMLLIAVTGWGQEQQRRLSAEAGFDHHFVKPVHPREIIPIIDAHVARRSE